MLLGVNIDHVATLRNARGGYEPSVIESAVICEKAGADGITVHLREDRRHIVDDDVFRIKKEINCRLNLEMALTDEMQKIALELHPQACCIVPEKRAEITTEGGLDVFSMQEKISRFIKPLLSDGIDVSLFIEPSFEQVIASAKTGVRFVELHTGAYSRAFGHENEEEEFLKLKDSAETARDNGLIVNAGHGLNYKNVYKMKEIDGIHELNIGHTIISRAVYVGLENAVKEMLSIVKNF